MKRSLILLVLFSLLISACGLPQRASPTPSTEQLQTQVASILTSIPQTSQPKGEATPTAGQGVITLPTVAVTSAAASTSEPISTELPTVTPFPTQAVESTALPTSQPLATATSGATIVPPASDPVSKLGTPSWKENFKNENNWSVGEDKFTSIQIANNQMKMTALSNLDGWRITWPTLKDFYMETTFLSGTCSGSDHYGIIARIPDKQKADQGYLFGFSCDGKYSIRKWDGKSMTNLVPWTANPAILSGPNQTNRMGILAVGGRLAIYANGTLLKDVQDTSYSEGVFGVFVGSSQSTNFSIYLNQIQYWENPNL